MFLNMSFVSGVNFAVNGKTKGEIRSLEPKINNPSHTSARITDLQPNNEYRFFVWARTSSGLGKKQSVTVLTKGRSIHTQSRAIYSQWIC